MSALLDPAIARKVNGDAASDGFRPRPFIPPEEGWREALQQCAHHFKGERCRLPAVARSHYCGGHDAKMQPHRYLTALKDLGPKFTTALNSAEISNAKYELAAAQTYAERLMEKAGDDEDKMIAVVRLLDQISKMIERIEAIGIQRATVWDANDVRAFGIAFGQMVNRHVTLEQDRKALMGGMKGILAGVDLQALPEPVEATLA